HSGSRLGVQAQLGIAASLEAQGKTADAATKYKELADRHPNDSTIPQIKTALARLYEAQNKPDLALKMYQEMLSGGRQDTWTMEAGVLAQELVQKHPELIPPRTNPPPAVIKMPTPPATSAPPALQSTGAPPIILTTT